MKALIHEIKRKNMQIKKFNLQQTRNYIKFYGKVVFKYIYRALILFSKGKTKCKKVKSKFYGSSRSEIVNHNLSCNFHWGYIIKIC